MELKEAYLLARNNTYKTFTEEVDYRITGHLSTTVSENEFEVKLILPVVQQSEQLFCEHPIEKRASFKSHGQDFCWKCGQHL